MNAVSSFDSHRAGHRVQRQLQIIRETRVKQRFWIVVFQMDLIGILS